MTKVWPDLTEAEQECRSYACHIQSCLERMSYQKERCKSTIDRYKQCVKSVEDRLISEGKPFSPSSASNLSL